MAEKSPGHAERIEALAEALSRTGAPASWCFCIAEGLLVRLLRHCWQKRSDIIHSAEEIDEAVGWSQPPCVLANMMVEAGLLVEQQGEYVMPSVLREAPEYVRSYWRRHERQTFDAAVSRQSEGAVPLPPPKVERKAEQQTEQAEKESDVLAQPEVVSTNLFGEPEQKNEPPSESGKKSKDAESTPGHKRLTEYWFRAYKQKYGRNPVFKGRDGKHFRDLLQQCSADDLEQALDNYLACDDPFFTGHDLGKFAGQINRWLAGGGGAATGGVQYGRAGDALPDA